MFKDTFSRYFHFRQDIVNKWEQKTKINPKNNSTILLGIALFGEIHKN